MLYEGHLMFVKSDSQTSVHQRYLCFYLTREIKEVFVDDPIKYESFLNRFIWSIKRTKTITANPGHSEPGNNGNEGTLHIAQYSRTGACCPLNLMPSKMRLLDYPLRIKFTCKFLLIVKWCLAAYFADCFLLHFLIFTGFSIIMALSQP